MIPIPGERAEKYPPCPEGRPSPFQGPTSVIEEPYSCSMENAQLKYKKRSLIIQACLFVADGIVSRPTGTLTGFVPLSVHRLSSLKMWSWLLYSASSVNRRLLSRS